jgi:hypothetical protein
MGNSLWSSARNALVGAAPNFGPEHKRPHPDDDAASPAPKAAKAHAAAIAGGSSVGTPAAAAAVPVRLFK